MFLYKQLNTNFFNTLSSFEHVNLKVQKKVFKIYFFYLLCKHVNKFTTLTMERHKLTCKDELLLALNVNLQNLV